MQLSWRLLGAWAALVVGGAAGVGGAVVAARWVSPAWAALLGGGVAAISTVATARSRQLLDRQWGLRQELRTGIALQSRAGEFPRVRDVTDLVAIGIHPAEARDNGPRRPATSVPTPYIPRDVDEDLREAVARAPLTVVVGESTAGKSRAAFEAIKTCTPDYRLAVPSGREALPAIVADLVESSGSVLWLDDLERFLGPGGLTPAVVASLTRGTGRTTVIVATMRTAEFERFISRAEPTLDELGRSAWRVGRDVLRSAHLITMRRLWSPAELAAAAPFRADSRIARGLRRAETFGIAETIAAGPELLRDWRNAWAPGSHPRGAALVAAAVDCRRAGLDEPVARDLLIDLHHHYLLTHGGAALRPEDLNSAWAWAQRPVHGASSLLIPTGSSNDGQLYLAFDYLVDQPDHDPIPLETWNLLVTRVAPRDAARVASEAFWRVRTAFHAAVDSGAVSDVFSRASAMSDRDNHLQAVQLLTDALNSAKAEGDVADQQWALRHQIAFFQILGGRVNQAEASFRELLAEAEQVLPPDDEYLQVVRHNIATCTRKRGDLPEAMAQFRRILADRERQLGPDDMNTLATRSVIAALVGEMGDPAEALRQTQGILADEERALGRDHTNTLSTRHSLASYLAESGQLAAAVDVLQALLPDLDRALGADHSEVLDARWDLARYHGQRGDRHEATRLFQEVLTERERILDADDPRLAAARDELDDFLTRPE